MLNRDVKILFFAIMKFSLSIGCFVVTLMCTTCAQPLHGIQKGYAFFKKSIPGNIQVDEKGNEVNPVVDTVRFIFIESKGKLPPSIDNVIYRNKTLNASILPVNQPQVQVGQEKISGKNIILKPARGNTLWKVLLISTDKKPVAGNAVIKLKGKRNGRPYEWVIEREIELEAEIAK